MFKKEPGTSERRRYLRLDTVFPVLFRLESPDGKQILSAWQQGFTRNVSKGGICLEVNNFSPDLALALKENKAKLSLEIEMPMIKKPVKAQAQVAWGTQSGADPNRYTFGLSYEHIDASANAKVMRYAWMKKLFIPVAISLILALSIGLGINTFINAKLTQGNKALVEQLIKILQDTSVAKQQIKSISREKSDLQLQLDALEQRIKAAEKEKKEKEERGVKAAARINALVEELSLERNRLQQQIISVQTKENNITEELLRLDKKKSCLEQANLDKMYQWLSVHQNHRSGLIMSFEGDSQIERWGFTYDQALAALAFINISDFNRAAKILTFFKDRAEKTDGRFFNAYYVDDGSPAEYVVHSGPNIWLGIAAAQYSYKSGDNSFLQLAQDIAKATIGMQSQDREGGIRGGPDVAWFATEHNLDAYAFFNMLYEITTDSVYEKARDKILNWLLNHTYDRSEIPVKRGKGDSTIATDTYAWSIAAIGPEKLSGIGMDPDRIMEFVEENCSVEVDYRRLGEGDAVKIKGFDFAPQRHLARGGIVSSEWTAQMVVSMKIMAKYYYDKEMPAKAHAYEVKADAYLAELANMIVSSPSPSGQGESCLPYATQDNVDTGHGWFTPKGSRTGSVAGTVYTIFAYYGYNPLQLRK